jgi:L-fuculose-phosphate aldolase
MKGRPPILWKWIWRVNVISGLKRPSTEFRMHLAIYKARDDVRAIVHAHPLYLSVLAVAGEPLKPVLDEMVPFLGGSLGVSDFAASGTKDLADNVVKALSNKSAACIANHGSVSVGKNVAWAFKITRFMEKYAHIYCLALLLGKARTIPEDRITQELGYYEMRRNRA